jgi:uncharacterized membrane protein YphA (DoxX/SURF4 family)
MSRINKLTFSLGRIIVALAIIAMGYSMFNGGFIHYEKYVHAVRKMFFPDSFPSHKPFGLQFTWEQLVTYLIRADAALLMLSGLLILTNQSKQGGFLLILALLFILATKDNPFLQSNLKSIKNEQGQRTFDFIKHLSAIGASLILIFAD